MELHKETQRQIESTPGQPTVPVPLKTGQVRTSAKGDYTKYELNSGYFCLHFVHL